MKKLLLVVLVACLLGCESEGEHTKYDLPRMEKFIDEYKPRVIVINRGRMTKEYLDLCIKKGYRVEHVDARVKTITVVRCDE